MAGICLGGKEVFCSVGDNVPLKSSRIGQDNNVPKNVFRCKFCEIRNNVPEMVSCKLCTEIGCRANKGSVVILPTLEKHKKKK